MSRLLEPLRGRSPPPQSATAGCQPASFNHFRRPPGPRGLRHPHRGIRQEGPGPTRSRHRPCVARGFTPFFAQFYLTGARARPPTTARLPNGPVLTRRRWRPARFACQARPAELKIRSHAPRPSIVTPIDTGCGPAPRSPRNRQLAVATGNPPKLLKPSSARDRDTPDRGSYFSGWMLCALLGEALGSAKAAPMFCGARVRARHPRNPIRATKHPRNSCQLVLSTSIYRVVWKLT